VSIAQTGANVTVTIGSGAEISGNPEPQPGGFTCTFSGTAGTDAITLTLTSCDVALVTNVACAIGSGTRDLYLASETISVNVTGNRLAGFVTEIWKVFDPARQSDVGQLLLSRHLRVDR
jgi:hypothetical protein